MKFKTKQSVSYGNWTVLEGPRKLSPEDDVKKCRCRCVCGEIREVSFKNLQRGLSKSCGCTTGKKTHLGGRKHGLSKSNIYVTWRNMLLRCQKETDPHYKNYGGRGIKVCERWQTFENFYEDMGDKPTQEHSIERINNSGDYEPGNCRWATLKEQANNRRSNHIVTYQGNEVTLMELANITGINHQTLWNRIVLKHMDVAAATALPIKVFEKKQKFFTYKGETKTVAQWAAEYGMSMQTLWHRLFMHKWTIEEALTHKVSLSARERYTAQNKKHTATE